MGWMGGSDMRERIRCDVCFRLSAVCSINSRRSLRLLLASSLCVQSRSCKAVFLQQAFTPRS